MNEYSLTVFGWLSIILIMIGVILGCVIYFGEKTGDLRRLSKGKKWMWEELIEPAVPYEFKNQIHKEYFEIKDKKYYMRYYDHIYNDYVIFEVKLNWCIRTLNKNKIRYSMLKGMEILSKDGKYLKI